MTRQTSRKRRPEFLYVTTTGRVTGLPREIEIWYASGNGKLYVLAEMGQKAQWVRNIQRDPRVRVRLGAREGAATARVLDRERDAEAWELARRLFREKYDWDGGLPVEIALEAR